MDKEEYYKLLQTYVDKVKELKEWLHSSEDTETKQYLQMEIEKQLTEMKEAVNKWGQTL